MAAFDKTSEAYIKLMKFLSWSKIVKTVTVVLIATSLYVTFENRQLIYQGVVRSSSSVRTMIQSPISKGTQESVNALLSKPSNIVGVQFVSVDFKTNSRNTEFFKSNNPQMEQDIRRGIEQKLGPTPFFTDDVKNNERNVSLINGDFVCYKVQETLVVKRFPGLEKYADTICSVSIPPYPGYFSGYITFWVKGEPSAAEVSELRAAARKMSIATYDAEISR